jgi:hypothetical protein
MAKLPGDYVAGLVDGEGHFGLNYRRDIKYKLKNRPEVRYRWVLVFAISMAVKDKHLLKSIGKTLGCGVLSISGGDAQYDVYKFEDLKNKVMPFFEKYRLRGSKSASFELWKEAILIIDAEKQRRRQKISKPATSINFSADELHKLQQIKLKLSGLHGLTKFGLAKGRPRKDI